MSIFCRPHGPSPRRLDRWVPLLHPSVPLTDPGEKQLSIFVGVSGRRRQGSSRRSPKTC